MRSRNMMALGLAGVGGAIAGWWYADDFRRRILEYLLNSPEIDLGPKEGKRYVGVQSLHVERSLLAWEQVKVGFFLADAPSPAVNLGALVNRRRPDYCAAGSNIAGGLVYVFTFSSYYGVSGAIRRFERFARREYNTVRRNPLLNNSAFATALPGQGLISNVPTPPAVMWHAGSKR